MWFWNKVLARLTIVMVLVEFPELFIEGNTSSTSLMYKIFTRGLMKSINLYQIRVFLNVDYCFLRFLICILFKKNVKFRCLELLMFHEHIAPAVTSVAATSIAQRFSTSVLLQEQRDELRPLLRVIKEEKTPQVCHIWFTPFCVLRNLTYVQSLYHPLENSNSCTIVCVFLFIEGSVR